MRTTHATIIFVLRGCRFFWSRGPWSVVRGSLRGSYSSCQCEFHRNQLIWKIVFSCLYGFYFPYQVIKWCPLSRSKPLNRYRLQRCFFFLFIPLMWLNFSTRYLQIEISLRHPVVRIQGRLSLLPLRLRTTIKHWEKTKGCVKYDIENVIITYLDWSSES